MYNVLRRGIFATTSILFCLGTVQAEVGSLWELGTSWRGANNQQAVHQSQWQSGQAGYTNQQVAYASQQAVQPSGYCVSDGYCSCDPGCYCESGCYCEPGCCCEPSCGCASCSDCCGCCDTCSPCCAGGGVYTMVDIMFLRAHVSEDGFGKLSEEYEFSPRATFGYENGAGQGGRARLWHYGHHLNLLNSPGGVRFEWNVLDLDLTKRFVYGRTDAVIGGGARLASAEIITANFPQEIDMLGLTLAADFETICFCRGNSYVSSIYGGRFSILGGDWDFGTGTATTTVHDDNIQVHELYAGFEYGCCLDRFSLYSQLKFEMQTWDSDVLAVDDYSVGFAGPSFSFGMAY